MSFRTLPFPALEGDDKRDAELLLSRHPLYGRVSREDLIAMLRERGADKSTIAGVLWFYESNRQYSAGHILDFVRLSWARPLLMVSAILDDRTCSYCRAVNGSTLPATEPESLAFLPPYCIACRSSAISLTESQAATRNCPPFPRELELPDPARPCNNWVFDLTERDVR